MLLTHQDADAYCGERKHSGQRAIAEQEVDKNGVITAADVTATEAKRLAQAGNMAS